ncbi:Uncharacterised protein [Achromobacter spanius]|uniref:hypothetical protein n=1 Tax=Achromobacter spanius TaxID=217203 RepID=UPI000C2C0049|nr:hypothetical protein [Achromobacter spanius]AUA58284.1 hypothetical protein CVS48_21060 [Achromobacter spanius]CAB3682452.1 hypothetical protein LMG5911_04056 [Achromobacter spanius]SPT38497.1 Uncharacterised protein [Achromobacter denitrificans]VEE59620.1 Uncharacterised protein [Achromobacter spanius]
MDAQRLINALKRKLAAQNTQELGKLLGLSQANFRDWESNGLTEEKLARAIVKSMRFSEQSERIKIAGEAIASLRGKLDVGTNGRFSQELGISVGTVNNWLKYGLTGRKLADGLLKSRQRAVKSAHECAIMPVVEYFQLSAHRRSSNGVAELFPTRAPDSTKALLGLKSVLENSHGIYVFYDSRGRALYVGKAQRQSLWKEMNLAFNRDRDTTQRVYRVQHPERGDFKTSDEYARQVKLTRRHLSHLATYFSAYKVDDALINELEALLVRSFANDLLNVKMERFGK